MLLGLLNMPSKADYNRLLSKIEALQGSLVNLNIKVDRLLAERDRPKRRRPPNRIRERVAAEDLTTRHGASRGSRAPMKIFHCDHCRQLVFFENVRCLACDHALAYAPDARGRRLARSEPARSLWRSAEREAPTERVPSLRQLRPRERLQLGGRRRRSEPLCRSCRLTRAIPDLGAARPQGKRWYRLEVAKRRLVYSLLRLGLPVVQQDRRRGARRRASTLLAETARAGAHRSRRRRDHDQRRRSRRRRARAAPPAAARALPDAARTLPSRDRPLLLAAPARRQRSPRGVSRAASATSAPTTRRRCSGTTTTGASGEWQDRFISAYASAHPWEDWAETWAHYLHMTDTLETAAACGLVAASASRRRAVAQDRRSGPTARSRSSRRSTLGSPLTYVLNNLNRGLGLPDGYPFVLSDAGDREAALRARHRGRGHGTARGTGTGASGPPTHGGVLLHVSVRPLLLQIVAGERRSLRARCSTSPSAIASSARRSRAAPRLRARRARRSASGRSRRARSRTSRGESAAAGRRASGRAATVGRRSRARRPGRADPPSSDGGRTRLTTKPANGSPARTSSRWKARVSPMRAGSGRGHEDERGRRRAQEARDRRGALLESGRELLEPADELGDVAQQLEAGEALESAQDRARARPGRAATLRGRGSGSDSAGSRRHAR